MHKYVNYLKNKWALFVAGILVGALIILGVRFVTYKPEKVHYHANFVVYINGQQEKFQGMRYYEETEAMKCSLEEIESPLERAHMHDNVYDVVHVEDHLVTWGNFFQNLGWGVGSNYLKSADEVYIPSTDKKLTFILNGKQVDDPSNFIIGDQDKLLVSYGSLEDEQVSQLYAGIKNNAESYDQKQDPPSCSGSRPTRLSDRFKHLF